MSNYVGYKLKLYPSPEQIHKIHQYFGYARFVYNLGITVYEEYYNLTKDDGSVKYKHLNHIELNNIITNLKNIRDDLSWMKKFDAKCGTIVLKDLILAYNKFFKHDSHRAPSFKSRKNHWQSFPIRKDRMSILNNQLYIPSFDTPISLKNIPTELEGFGNKDILNVNNERRNVKHREKTYINFINPRIVYNGVNYYITFSIEVNSIHRAKSCDRFINNDVWNHKSHTDIVGLDWGIKHSNWFVASNGMKLERPNQTKLDKRIAGYQRKLARQKRINDKTIERTNQYTKNELKTLKRWNKLEKKHTNQRLNKLHKFVNDIIETKPEAIVLEDIKYQEMIKNNSNHDMITNINNSIPYIARHIFTYKCESNNIKVIIAEREFKSTQTCSNCGHEQKMGSRRTYKCPVCGIKIDRDLNSAFNLRNYGYNLLHF